MGRQPNKSTKIIQSVDRAIEILDCFNEREQELSLAAICSRLSLNKSTALGIINTLINRSYLEKNLENGRYRLGEGITNRLFISKTARSTLFDEESKVYMKRLAIRYGVTCYLYGYTNYVLYCIDMAITDAPGMCVITANKMAYHAAASGKLVLAQYAPLEIQHYLESKDLAAFTPMTHIKAEEVLADIEQTRRNGYSSELEEVDLNLCAYAVPIHDKSGRLVGTISCSGLKSKIVAQKDDIIRDLREASAEISRKVF